MNETEQDPIYFLLDDDGQVQPVHDDGSGVPVVVQWALQLTDTMRSVAHDMACGLEISTVFLGMDARWIVPGMRKPDAPSVFETAVFAQQRAGVLWLRRTGTLEEAQHTHVHALQMVHAGEIKAGAA